jgi:hypothetical protein
MFEGKVILITVEKAFLIEISLKGEYLRITKIREEV